MVSQHRLRRATRLPTAGFVFLALGVIAGITAVILLVTSPRPAAPRIMVSAAPIGTAYPETCRNLGYCELGPDSVCTIIEQALDAGTPDAQLIDGLTAERSRLRSSDFDACPQYRYYWHRILPS